MTTFEEQARNTITSFILQSPGDTEFLITKALAAADRAGYERGLETCVGYHESQATQEGASLTDLWTYKDVARARAKEACHRASASYFRNLKAKP